MRGQVSGWTVRPRIALLHFSVACCGVLAVREVSDAAENSLEHVPRVDRERPEQLARE